jgi:hypothetical protein
MFLIAQRRRPAINESEMARSSECREQFAQKVLDGTDIVIALGKAWKRRNRR